MRSKKLADKLEPAENRIKLKTEELWIICGAGLGLNLKQAANKSKIIRPNNAVEAEKTKGAPNLFWAGSS